jgi:hypothetical protein
MVGKKQPYSLSKKVGIDGDAPVAGQTYFQHNDLKGAFDIDFIIVNNMIESAKMGGFIFDSNLGKIDRSPNEFFTEDTVVVPYNKLGCYNCTT